MWQFEKYFVFTGILSFAIIYGRVHGAINMDLLSFHAFNIFNGTVS